MKLIVISILNIFLCLSVFSEDTVTIYYNQDWKPISNKDQAEYYRKAYYDSSHIWTARDYFISGKLQMSGSYKSKGSDVKIGHFIYYFENGNIKSEGTYNMGKVQGQWTYFFENGNKEYVGNYLNDVPNGQWIYYYESGEKKSEGKFVNSKSTGVWQYWYISGEKRTEGKYVNGVKEGLWKYWYANGMLKNEENIKNGFPISATGYHMNGVVSFNGSYADKLPHGEWTYYNSDGRVTMKGKYNKGILVGEWVRSFDTGSMKTNYSSSGIANKKYGGIARNEYEQ